MTNQTSGKSVKRDARFGIFSFFTGAGFLDLGFEDAGFTPMMAAEFSHAETRSRREVQR